MFNGSFKTLTIAECIDRYTVDFNRVSGTVVTYGVDYGNDSSPYQSESLSSVSIGYGNSGSMQYQTTYDWMCEPDGYCGEELPSNLDQIFIQPTFWVYPNREFTLFNYDGQLQSFNDSASLYNYYNNIYNEWIGADLQNNWLHDMSTLGNYILRHNPDDKELRSYMRENSSSTWQNVTWAESVSFEILSPTDGGAFLDLGMPFMVNNVLQKYWTVSISHCQSQPLSTPKCQLRFNIPLCLIVIFCNAIKVACIFLSARRNRQDLFLTVGDALASFLTNPDMSTKGRCLMTTSRGAIRLWRNALQEDWKSSSSQRKHSNSDIHHFNDADIPMIPAVDSTIPRASLPIHPMLMPKRKRWFQAATWKEWTIVIVYFTGCLVACPVLALFGSRTAYGTADANVLGGFDGFTGNPDTMLQQLGQNLYALVLLANTPQLILTIFYFFVNGIFTSMLAAAEYNDYATERKPLRVSWPKGEQRSTYFLSLPYRYSITLMALSTVLHWLLTESFYVVLVNDYDVHGQLNRDFCQLAISFSVLPMLIIVGISVLCLGGLLFVSFKRFKSTMPLLTLYCSVGLSAVCHPPADDTDAALGSVQWGEIPGSEDANWGLDLEYDNEIDEVNAEDDDISDDGGGDVEDRRHARTAHCSFSSEEVIVPNKTMYYY
ncbi:hypothetical protein N7456_008608 [Penicillium angulare]|uniref:Uncharacterized protein n=1 Tax=Penicillium angulare TaxID=116970 RepID=A0A9W9K5C0_9EURO|nr:hypothetical protein N7456_008608 [Penicillium angulare]